MNAPAANEMNKRRNDLPTGTSGSGRERELLGARANHRDAD